MSKPPKPTPKNMEWGGVSKSVSLLKTSVFQKLAGSKSKEVPPEFLQLTLKVKTLKKLLDELITLSRHYTKTIVGYSEGGSQSATAFKELSQCVPPNDVLAPALQKFCDIQIEIEQYRMQYKDHFLSTMVGASEKFIIGEINGFKETHKMWKKVRLEYDAAKAKVDDALKTAQTSKKPQPLDIFIAQTHYHVARKKEAARFEIVLDKATDVLWSRDFDVLQESVKCIQALHEFILKSYTCLYQLEEYLAQLKEHTSTRRQEFFALKEKRNEDRKAKEAEEFANRYTPLVELLSAEDLAVVNAICVTAGAEQESILESLINILDAHKMTLPIIKLGITREVEKTSNASTLFRGNTMATKLMTAWTRMTGRNYLASTLRPLLDYMVEQITSDVGYEVDPGKLADPSPVPENMKNLQNACKFFLTGVLNSLPQCPLPFRSLAHHLRDEVVARFPEAKYTTVGGFIFLRFFCPAILSPDSTSPPLLSKVDQNLRRALILISKSLQNLANGLDFGNKEPYMQDMNSFINDNKALVENFFDTLATTPDNEEYEPLCTRAAAIQKELPALHTKIVQNLEKIAKSLVQYKQEEAIPALAVVLAELGEDGITVATDVEKKKKK